MLLLLAPRYEIHPKQQGDAFPRMASYLGNRLIRKLLKWGPRGESIPRY